MNTPIQVKVRETGSCTVAFIAMKGPYSQIAEAFDKLYGWIGEKGYIPAGPPSGVYFNVPGQVPDGELAWELRSPVAGDTAASALNEQGLGVKKLDSVQVATTMHKGPFDTVAQTYEAMVNWINENGYEIVGPPDEVYITNPQDTPPDKSLTEVRFPVRKK